MKIVKILGGLGNQMFQYAFYLALKNKHKSVKVDLSGYQDYELHNGFELTRVFNLYPEKASLFQIKLYTPHYRSWFFRKLRRVGNLKNAYHEEEEYFAFDSKALDNPKAMLYWGYWQNQDYFMEIEQEIRRSFKFKTSLNETNEAYLKLITANNSVSIHIRRGDYLKDELLGGLCSINYYRKAIELITTLQDAPVFFIFSDDLQWCKDNLEFETKTQIFYISGNDGNNSYIDMQLMSYCQHNIIANSSFSWWAAWLNENPNKIIIGPEKWTNDNNSNHIIPEQWIRL